MNKKAVNRGMWFIAVLFFYLSVSNLAFGAFQIPNDAYRMHELDNAIANAVDDKWALAFVLTDENTRCSLATKATVAVFEELADHSIIVYVAMHDSFGDLPEVVVNGFNSNKSGLYLPKTVITNPKATKLIDIVPYKRNSNELLDNLAQSKEKIDGYFNTASPLVKYSILVVAGFLFLIFFRKRKL